MIQPDFERLRERLIEERTHLRGTLAESTAADAHPAEVGSDSFEHVEVLGLAEQATRAIKEIDRALDRMEQGTYGTCESCGRAISVERLEAIPSASRCAACQSKVEQGFHEP